MHDYSTFEPHEFDDSRGAQAEIDLDHATFHTPLMTAFLTRHTERVRVAAYARPRMVVEVYPPAPLQSTAVPGAHYPGMIRQTDAADGQPVSETFADVVLHLERNDWVHTSASAR